jgi:predicted transcriptional regulator
LADNVCCVGTGFAALDAGATVGRPVEPAVDDLAINICSASELLFEPAIAATEAGTGSWSAALNWGLICHVLGSVVVCKKVIAVQYFTATSTLIVSLKTTLVVRTSSLAIHAICPDVSLSRLAATET